MGKFTWFLVGGAIGAGAALALTPKTGEETRAFVAEKANAVVGEAKDFGAGFPDSAIDAYKSIRSQGASMLQDAQGKTGELAAGATAAVKSAPKANDAEADELRAKIEAARQRIAAQVMENAEQSKAVDIAAEAKQDAAEVVEDAKANAAEVVKEAKHAAADAKAEAAAKAEEAAGAAAEAADKAADAK